MNRGTPVAIVLLLPPLLLADSAGPAGPPAAWSDCPVGTKVEYRFEEVIGEDTILDHGTEVAEVVRRDSDKTVLNVLVVNDRGKRMLGITEVHSRKAPVPPIISGFGEGKALRRVGDETLNLAGRSIACSVWENSDGEKMGRFHLALDSSRLPIQVVKSTIRGNRSLEEDVVESWEDRLLVSGREIRTLRMVSTFTSVDSTFTYRCWLARDVPGYRVKTHSVWKSKNPPHFTHTTELVRFGRW